MTDEIDQIVAIVQLTLPTYAVSKVAQEVAPSISIEIDSVNSQSITKDQTYSVHIMATSAANLKTAVDTLLKLDVLHPNAYTGIIPDITVKGRAKQADNNAKSQLQVASPWSITNTSGSGTADLQNQTAGGDRDIRSLACNFVLDQDLPSAPYTRTSCLLHITSLDTPLPAAPGTFNMKVYGIDEDTPVLTNVHVGYVSGHPATTPYTSAHLEVAIPDTWVAMQTYDWDVSAIVDEITARTGWDEESIGMLFFDDSQDLYGKHYVKILTGVDDSYTELRIIYECDTTGFPYALEMKFKRQYTTENSFDAEILLNARWSNI